MPIPITKDNYYEFIPSNWRSNTGYIQRYNDVYILHPALSTSYPSGANAANSFITAPSIYFDNGVQTENETGTLRATGGMWISVNALGSNPLTIAQMSAKGITLLIKYGPDGDSETSGNLRYSTSGNTFNVLNGRTFWITSGYAYTIGIPSKVGSGTTGATGTYTFVFKNYLKAPTTGSLYEDRYYLWRVQYCFGHRVGSDPLYTGAPLIYDAKNAYADIISRGNSGGTYFHNFEGFAFPYTTDSHPNEDSGNWPAEYTP